MTNGKTYIGSGKATKWNGVTVTLRMDEVQQFVRETEDGAMLSFIVSPRKTPSPKGSTHSAFVLAGTPEVQADMPAPAVAAEPEATPVKGRRLRRITAEQAAELRAQQAA